MQIARVFPRKTEGTPNDELSFVNVYPAICQIPPVDEVHISVTFTADKHEAELLADHWKQIAPVKIGGPAYDDPGADFEPGMYLKRGFTITSRGCPNECWYCDAWKRSGTLRELPIRDGWIVQDDNFLACSDKHIRAVFDMLWRQKEDRKPIEFRGMEAALLKEWHVAELWGLKPSQLFFAYDTPGDRDPLYRAGKLLRYADFTRSHLRCYVLVGHPRDTMDNARIRLLQAWDAGFLPFSMLYMDKDGHQDPAWAKFMRTWCRPASTKSEIRRQFQERSRTNV